MVIAHLGAEQPSDVETTTSTAMPCHIDDMVDTWWLVHTKPRNEKALARDLEAYGVRYYLPLARLRRHRGGRVSDVRLPLFSGYLFLCGGEIDRYRALATNRVVNVIPVVNQDRLRSDLRQICRLVDHADDLDVYPGIQRGRRCRVTGGALRGLEGVVLYRRDICRVFVAVEMLGQSAEVEIDASLLEVID